MKMPTRHLADETLARVLIASRRTQFQAPQPEGPAEMELVEYTGDAAPAEPAPQPPAEEPAVAGAGGDVPPITDSGLDLGAVLGGADSFDAMLGSLGGK